MIALESMYRLLFEAVREGSVSAVQKAASRIFESAVSVTDTSFRVLAADADPGSTDDMLEKSDGHIFVSAELLELFREHNLISSLIRRPGETIVVDWGYFSSHPHLTTGIFWQNQILGSVTVLVESAECTPDRHEALQACADALALVMHSGDSGRKMQSVERNRFISKLFSGAASQKDLDKAVKKLFFRQSGRYVILATEFLPDASWLENADMNPYILVCQSAGLIQVLAPCGSAELQELEGRIRNRGYRYGLSCEFGDLLLCGRMARQAAAALEFGNRSEQKKAGFSFPEHALDMLLDSSSLSPDFVHPAIREIEQYDAQNNTEYLKTLQVWLAEKMDYSAAARALNLHRNSLYYRMQRIRDIFSLNLDDMNTCVQLYLSLLR